VSASVVLAALLLADVSLAIDSRDMAVVTVVAGAAEQRTDDFAVAPTAALAVVRVSVNSCGERSSGSGFVVANGMILTAAHVVGDAGLVRIDIGARAATGEVMGRYADGRDIAVIKIDTGTLPQATRGTIPPLGDPITIVGHPQGGPITASVGARVEPLPTTSDAVPVPDGGLIALSAVAGRGFSGGPAVDADGRLIGIVVAAESGTGNTIVIPVGDPAEVAGVELIPNICHSAA